MIEYPLTQRTLPAVLADKAAVHGDAPFLLGDEPLGYAGLRDAAASFAGGLQALGVQRGEPVLIMLPNSRRMLVTVMGVSWAGSIEVPVNTGYRGDILRYVVEDSQARTMVVHADFLPVLAEVRAALSTLSTLIVVGSGDDGVSWEDVAAGASVEAADVGPGDLMAIMYTSGTTGAAKGVMCYHHQAYQYANPLGNHMLVDGEVVYLTVPLFHIGGQWAAAYGALLADGRLVLRERFSVSNFWSDVDRFGVTQTLLLGVMVDFLAKQPQRPDDAHHSLQRVAMAPLPLDDRAFAERFGIRINQGWGLTEAGCVTAPPRYDEPVADRLSAGRLRTDLYELRLVDEHDVDVPDGSPGEAIVRARQPYVTMAGYWRKPEATAECLRGGWLHTGDLLQRRPDGSYTFVDRMSHRIRRRGENISSLHIEQEVLAHPDVLECAAIGVPSEYSEDEVKVVLALRGGTQLSAPELVEFLQARLPAFMLPRFVEIRTELPKTQTGKIRKDLLREDGGLSWDRERTETA